MFELSNDVTLVKSGLSTVGSDVSGVKKELKKVANKASAAEQARYTALFIQASRLGRAR